ncbi:MAG: hypothetical protein ABSC48_15655 [Terracidiphilus sp.]
MYDADTQLTQRGSTAMTYDANGSTLSDGMNTCVRDALNRLVSADNHGASLSHDPLGRRVSKTIQKHGHPLPLRRRRPRARVWNKPGTTC